MALRNVTKNTNTLYSNNIDIHDSPLKVWKALTAPEHMKRWMSESPIEISTDWTIGAPITIRGVLSQTPFENKGNVIHFEPEERLKYSQLSSLSNLPEQPESYTTIEFVLRPNEKGSSLTINLSNFPTDIIYKHLVFYWNTTLRILKIYIEQAP